MFLKNFRMLYVNFFDDAEFQITLSVECILKGA